MATIDPSILTHLSHMQPALYWLDEDPLEPLPHPTLIGDATTNLCIVGAGYTGLWTALLAKEQNPDREVIVLEQREPVQVPLDAMVASAVTRLPTDS